MHILPLFKSSGTARVLVVLALLLIPLYAVPAGGAAEKPPTVTVTGRGEVTAVPDQATITVGVQLFDKDARTASSKLSTRMEAVVTALRQAGVPEQHIRTTNYSIVFQREHQPGQQQGQNGTGDRPAGTYRVQNMVRVEISEVDRAAAIVETAIEAGANQMHGIQFSFSDPASLEAKARNRAMNNARTRAKALAQAAGKSLGEVVEIHENLSSGTNGPQVRQLEAGMGGGTVQPGEARHTVRVQVSYELE